MMLKATNLTETRNTRSKINYDSYYCGNIYDKDSLCTPPLMIYDVKKGYYDYF